ncbi:MAG: hypothetical protein COB49_02120 [Alphaproteobacteria bacterium]|nr:MAG: hypothetical protein COB49_02120 [Alphaproteobacteria bacterium]
MSEPLQARDFGGDYESQWHHDNAVAIDRAIRRDRLCQRLALAMHGRVRGDNPALTVLVDQYPEATALILHQFEKGQGA